MSYLNTFEKPDIKFLVRLKKGEATVDRAYAFLDGPLEALNHAYSEMLLRLKD